jgi:phosphate transport system protein
MNKQLEERLSALREKVLLIGSLVESAIAKSLSAMSQRDLDLARAVVGGDDEIDQMEVELEQDVVTILARQQLVASDLRFAIAVLKINNDLERMGDLAVKIAKKILFLIQHQYSTLPRAIDVMAAKAQRMAKLSLDSLVNRDATLAQEVIDSDEEVDLLRRSIQEQVESQIAYHPEQTECLMRVLSISRHLERVADMASNIAEEVIFMIDGHVVRHELTP